MSSFIDTHSDDEMEFHSDSGSESKYELEPKVGVEDDDDTIERGDHESDIGVLVGPNQQGAQTSSTYMGTNFILSETPQSLLNSILIFKFLDSTKNLHGKTSLPIQKRKCTFTLVMLPYQSSPQILHLHFRVPPVLDPLVILVANCFKGDFGSNFPLAHCVKSPFKKISTRITSGSGTGGTRKWRCNICGQDWYGSITKVNVHFLFWTGKDVLPCNFLVESKNLKIRIEFNKLWGVPEDLGFPMPTTLAGYRRCMSNKYRGKNIDACLVLDHSIELHLLHC